MGIGKIIDNDTFYEGYEGEPQIVLSLSDMEVLHIWEGYFEDIYGAPALDGKGWNGFTRDYQQMEGIFADDGTAAELDPKEYLDDLMLYKDKAFDYEETAQVFDLMANLFEKAVETSVSVKAEKM